VPTASRGPRPGHHWPDSGPPANRDAPNVVKPQRACAWHGDCYVFDRQATAARAVSSRPERATSHVLLEAPRRLFKAVFQRPRHAAGLLRSIFPPALVAALDWRTLRLESGELTRRHGGELRNDLRFSIRFRRSRTRLYVPTEHQSACRRNLPVRALGYCSALVDRLQRMAPKGKPLRLPLLEPVLVSNAPGGWTAPTSMKGLLEPHPRGLGVRPFGIELIVDDLTRRSDAELQARPLPAFPKVALWALRDGRSMPTLLRRMPAWAETLRAAAVAPDRHDTLPLLFRYIAALHPDKVKFERFRVTLITLVPETEEPVMSYLDQLRAESHQQGSLENARKVLQALLKARFDTIPREYTERIESANEPQLEKWIVQFVDADTLEAVFAD
jgi:hypothetical protein